MRFARLLLSVVVVAACADGPVGPAPVDADVLVAERNADPRLVDAPSPPTATLQDGRVVVRGASGAERCHTVQPRLYIEDSVVTVRVRAARRPGGCQPTAAVWQYQIAYPLPAGTYRVRVLHRIFDAPERVMLDGMIVVP